MDISPEYILQCEKAKEIRELRKNNLYQSGDYVADGTGVTYCPTISLIHSKSKLIWLPRQDQLQEMIPLIVEGQTGYPEVSAAVLNKFLPFQWGGFFKSMEQLWLAFVMKDKYGKVWSGTDWTKQEVSVGS